MQEEKKKRIAAALSFMNSAKLALEDAQNCLGFSVADAATCGLKMPWYELSAMSCKLDGMEETLKQL